MGEPKAAESGAAEMPSLSFYVRCERSSGEREELLQHRVLSVVDCWRRGLEVAVIGCRVGELRVGGVVEERGNIDALWAEEGSACVVEHIALDEWLVRLRDAIRKFVAVDGRVRGVPAYDVVDELDSWSAVSISMNSWIYLCTARFWQ